MSPKDAQESANGTARPAAKKAATRPDPHTNKADEESAVLAKLAAVGKGDGWEKATDRISGSCFGESI